MNLRIYAVAGLFPLGFPCSGFAQSSEPTTIVALEISEPIRLDGVLDEAAWSRATHISNFTQRELDYGRPASERTEVAVLFDADALYIGFWGFDAQASRIRANEMARDFSWGAEDNFEVVLDPFHDNRNGYLFVTNPNGARADALIADNGGTVNRDWDGVWDVRARRTDEGWFAEMRIPFSSLRFPAGEQGSWGINFERNVRRIREQAMWQGWSRDYNLERVSQAGTLSGIRGTGSVRLADARPYVAGGVERVADEGTDRLGHAGLDVSYLPVPNWKINLTLRPDFAQVESDREEVNLTRFSLFYPEKRTFFLEGSEFFAFDLGSDVRPFYSRRIGLAADRSEVPILGGVRVLGKEGGTTLGAMVLRTEGTDQEPPTTFGVGRWKRDVLDESSVGLIGIVRDEPGRTSATYGTDLRYGTSELFGEREFEAGVVVAGTYVSDASRPAGWAQRVFLEYPNDLVEFSASWQRTDSAFDPTVGYLRRANFQRFATELNISPRPGFLPFVQRMEFKPLELSYYRNNRTGSLQSLYAEVVPLAFTLRSGESFELNLQRHADHPVEAFELVDDVSIEAGTYWFTRWSVEASSYRARPLSVSAEVSGGDFYLGTRRESTVSMQWKAGGHLSVSAEWTRNRIALFGEDFVVDEAVGRVDLAVSPRLFGAVAAQWNNEDDEAILNFRLNWIPEPGSDLYLVVNQQADTRDVFWGPRRTTVLSKLVWRFAF